MSNLEHWTVPQEIQALPCLLRLSINGLRKLTNFSVLFRQCSLLTELELVGGNILNSLEGLQYLTRLEKLKIHTSNSLKDLGQEEILSGLASLQDLSIESCSGLVYWPEGLKHLTILKKLHISGCQNLEALPEGMGNLKSLTDLYICSLSKLASIPNGLQHLAHLEILTIVNCEPKVSLKWVASFLHLPSLEIDRSQSLTHLIFQLLWNMPPPLSSLKLAAAKESRPRLGNLLLPKY